jgi:fatty-acyl-CoA synthase
MNLRLFLEDIREIPTFVLMLSSLLRASNKGRETCAVLLDKQTSRFPERIFLRFEKETVTYEEYNRGANRYAHVLNEAGIKRGEPVAIMMKNSPDFLMAQAAMAKLGSIGALINTHLSGPSLEHVLRISGARHLLVDHECLPSVVPLTETIEKTIWAAGETSALPSSTRSLQLALDAASQEDFPVPDLRGGDIFLYIYTSGTTGLPKPAIIRHSRFAMAGIALSRLFGITSRDVLYAPLPLYHGESNFVAFSVALRAGATFASRRSFSAEGFFEDVRRHGVTFFNYVGELCRYLLRVPPGPQDRDHKIRLAAGAGLRPDIWKTFQERFAIPRIIEMYGETEGNVALMNLKGVQGSVGRPFPFQHSQVRLARYNPDTGERDRGPDGFLVECKVGETGELLGKIGKGLMPHDGYTNPEENEKKIIRNAFKRGDAYFRTGDTFHQDAAGNYYFVDRVGDTFRWKGENVSTQEVAELLNACPGITETNVYGVKIPHEDGRAGMASLVLEPGVTFDPEAFYQYVASKLPPYARPLFVRLVQEMHVTGTLKQRKIELHRDGYDPERAKPDPFYFRDDEARRYVPMTDEVLARLKQGTLKI